MSHDGLSTLCLVGLRCVGKTTLGRRLAEHLSLPFVDLDDELEPDRVGPARSAGDCLRDLGEEGFRDLESAALERVLREDGPRVAATGGGIVLRAANRELLRTRARCLWLHAPAEQLVMRATSDATVRPALSTGPPLDEWRAMEEERREFYAEVSAARIDASGDPDEVLALLIAET
ncbi:MAG TPA: shikimate kinase [Planctomycetes bacterium]|nr:shikimate kinase [Planctomycetota bacterium]HIK59928.1 shikimate kinase [Planctomycetota bacterium]